VRTVVRDHVAAVTALLTMASLALIFGSVLGSFPSGLLPRAPDPVLGAIPHVNAVISLIAIALIATGWYSARSGQIRRHRAAMLLATGLFAAFLGLYLYRVTLLGPMSFPGPAVLYRWLYLPVLAVHITLAIICIPLLYYVLLIGLSHPVSAIPRTRHPTVGRIAASLWLVSFTLGTVVYLLLYVVY
jgi:putative membrane protein